MSLTSYLIGAGIGTGVTGFVYHLLTRKNKREIESLEEQHSLDTLTSRYHTNKEADIEAQRGEADKALAWLDKNLEKKLPEGQ